MDNSHLVRERGGEGDLHVFERFRVSLCEREKVREEVVGGGVFCDRERVGAGNLWRGGGRGVVCVCVCVCVSNQ